MYHSKVWKLASFAIIVTILASCSGRGQFEPIKERNIEITQTGLALAQDLTSRLTNAKTNKDRIDALLYVMRAFNVGVYSPSGQPILRGAERTDRDFFLYDFEIDLMARSLGRQQTVTIRELANMLTQMGFSEDGQPVTAEAVSQGLQASVFVANQYPNARISLFPLLLRELGLHQATPYDMLNGVSSDTQLNSLQAWLILADTAIPFIQEAEPLTSSIPLSPGAIMVSNNVPNPNCKDIGNVVKEEWSFLKWVLTQIPKIKVGATPLWLLVDGLHGDLLAFSIKVSSVHDTVETHYGHEQPGKELTFGIRVEMLDQLPDILFVQCGWLLGVEFPKKGPIEGVKVVWDNANGDLDQHGEWNCGNPCVTLTGKDGIATMVFKPKNEKAPYGQGVLKEDSGVIEGVALYQSRHRNYIGSVFQVFYPKYGFTVWFVDYHESGKWQGRITITGKETGNKTGPLNNTVDTHTETVDKEVSGKMKVDSIEGAVVQANDGSEVVNLLISGDVIINRTDTDREDFKLICAGVWETTFKRDVFGFVEIKGNLQISNGHYQLTFENPVISGLQDVTYYKNFPGDGNFCNAINERSTNSSPWTDGLLPPSNFSLTKLEGEIDPNNPNQIVFEQFIKPDEPDHQGSYTIDVELTRK